MEEKVYLEDQECTAGEVLIREIRSLEILSEERSKAVSE